MSELKPCPFCGSDDVFRGMLEEVHYVECCDCCAKVETYNGIEDTLKRDYLEIRSHCRELGLAFWCAENRLRSLGDSTACCGCGDIPGFEGNPFNCVSVKNGSGAVATEKMLQKGTAYCFNHVYQDAGAPNLTKEKSFHEMMQNSAKMFI